MLAVIFFAAMAAVATAANAPVTSADLVTPGDQYPMPQGLDSWTSVLADVFIQKVVNDYDQLSFRSNVCSFLLYCYLRLPQLWCHAHGYHTAPKFISDSFVSSSPLAEGLLFTEPS